MPVLNSQQPTVSIQLPVPTPVQTKPRAPKPKAPPQPVPQGGTAPAMQPAPQMPVAPQPRAPQLAGVILPWQPAPRQMRRVRSPRRYGAETTEEDFHRILDANPDDHHTRLVFADWLQERGDPRAEGYRALGMLRKRANHWKPAAGYETPYPESWYWGHTANEHYQNRPDWKAFVLDPEWMNQIASSHPGYDGSDAKYWRHHEKRRQADDAAAIAFSQLSPEVQARITQQPTQMRRLPTRVIRYARLTLGPPRPWKSPLGRAGFEHDYHDELGNKLGVLQARYYPDERRLHIHYVGPEDAQAGEVGNTVGASGVHSLRDELKKFYPDAQTVSGVRKGGFRTGTAGKTVSKPLKRQLKPRRYALDMGETIRQNVEASQRRMRGNGYVQDTTAGGVLADALDEVDEPHAPFFRNLSPGSDSVFIHSDQSGRQYRQPVGTRHPVSANVDEGSVRWSIRPSTDPAAVVAHRTTGLPRGSFPSHTAVMHAPALREWASHPKVGPSLRAALLNAADHLEAQVAVAPKPGPDDIDQNRTKLRRRPKRYSAPTQQREFDQHFVDTPGDRNHALVYADWLQEQGKDAHAEIVRHHVERTGMGVSNLSYYPSEVYPHRVGDFHVEMGEHQGKPHIHLYRIADTPRDEAEIERKQEEQPVYRLNWWYVFPHGAWAERNAMASRLHSEGARVHRESYGLQPDFEQE